MLILELTVEQKNDLVGLVDMLLKLNGVAALTKAVDIMNVLNSARVKPTEFDLVQSPEAK